MVDQEGALQQLLHFDPPDLDANRDGRLGPGQVPRLTWSGIWRLVVGPALLIASLALALTLLDVPLGSVSLLVVAGLGLALTWQGFAFLVDAIDGRVAFVTAPLVPRVVRGKSTTYYAACGPVSKRISSRTYAQLPQGLTCHLYYAPGSRSLLAIEPASESEPKPAHPFGPDSAHVWDRLRVSWIAITLGVVGLLFAGYGIVTAHPAHSVPVEGTVSFYSEHHGRSTSRYLYLRGDPDAYTPYAEDSYGPPMPPFATLTGRNVVLYVNEGTRTVLAIDDGEQLHVSDWYVYPEHQTRFEIVLSVIAGAAALAAVAGGMIAIVVGRRMAATGAQQQPALAKPDLYAPPSVRPWQANWAPALALVLVGAAVGLAIALGSHR